ncbi:MAG: GC-type dockerin domain-anchored protein [Phycisphaerales bacterium]
MNRFLLAGLIVSAAPSLALAQTFASYQPVSGGGVARWSQLWQDPGPNGNDLDGDAVCWTEFVLASPASINHIEWWGTGACELGFRIEFWPQDPGTVAYQPLGVFYYGGNHNVHRTAGFDTTAYTTTPGPGGILHHSLDLATPVALPANDAANPRWFIAIIGLTHQAYVPWNWSQSTAGNHTFQFIRGEGPQFRALGDGRAVVISNTSCPADWNHDLVANSQDFFDFIGDFFAGSADFSGDGQTNSQDFFDFVTAFFVGC